jgi:hypothetical protein
MPRPTPRQIGWFCGLWLAGVLAVGAVAALVRAALGA